MRALGCHQSARAQGLLPTHGFPDTSRWSPLPIDSLRKLVLQAEGGLCTSREDWGVLHATIANPRSTGAARLRVLGYTVQGISCSLASVEALSAFVLLKGSHKSRWTPGPPYAVFRPVTTIGLLPFPCFFKSLPHLTGLRVCRVIRYLFPRVPRASPSHNFPEGGHRLPSVPPSWPASSLPAGWGVGLRKSCVMGAKGKLALASLLSGMY